MEHLDREKIGRFISERRRELGLTQQQLGERLFVSNKAVSKWERGQSFPDIALMSPLAESLGVSVAELLNGEVMDGESFSGQETRAAAGRAMEFSEGQLNERQRRTRRRWQARWCGSLGLSLAEAAFLLLRGESAAEMSDSVFLVQGLCLLFGLWACFFIRERLPAFYDENRLGYVSDGIFHLSLAGVSFNNSNWPHIVSALRVWTVGMPVLFPVLFLLLKPWWNSVGLAVTLLGCLGLFFPVAAAGKKYE